MGGKCRSRLLAASCSLPLKIRLLTDACVGTAATQPGLMSRRSFLMVGRICAVFLLAFCVVTPLKSFCVSFGPASPRIVRHGPALPRRPYRYTEVLPRIPCPPALLAPPQVPYVLDLRAILRSIIWRLAPDGQIHLDALMGEFGPAPSGDYLEVGGGGPFSVGDRTYLRVDLLGDPPAPPETSSEDGSSDDGSGDSDGSADEPDPPRPPPPPTGSRNYRL